MANAISNANDGSKAPPRLLCGISWATVLDLPSWSVGWRDSKEETYAALKESGFEALQSPEPQDAHAAGLIPTGMMRVFEDVSEMRDKAMGLRDAGCDCASVHLGTGLEGDDEVMRLASALVDISARERFPLYLETHRATMTQDMRRVLDLIERLPEIRFNGDFAHWYIGHELTYGDIELKFASLAPVFERTRFLHLRVASNAFAQLTADDPSQSRHSSFYERMWTAACAGFLRSARPGDYMPVLPELLPAFTAYPKMVKDAGGEWQEESDRWTQAGVLIEMAKRSFAAAQALADSSAPKAPAEAK